MLVVHRFSLFLTLLEEVLSVINVDYTEKAHPLQYSRISFLEKRTLRAPVQIMFFLPSSQLLR